jgi:hypothetical protein
MSAAAAGLPIVGAIKKAKKAVDLAELIRENCRKGKKFEAEVLEVIKQEAELAPKRRFLAATLNSGKVRRTLPDALILAPNNVMIEIKNVQVIDMSTGQLEAQLRGPAAERLKYRLIAPSHHNPQSIPQAFKDLLQEPDLLDLDAEVQIFDPIARKLRTIWPE